MRTAFAALIAQRQRCGLLHVRADLLSLAYMLGASTLFLVHWHLPTIQPILVAVACAMAYGLGCIQHDQAHLPMWRSPLLNHLTDTWLQVLRGDGVWSWMPTHVGNHHRYMNHRGDLTLTWRSGNGNHLGNLLVYTLTTAVLYAMAVSRYFLRSLYARRRRGLIISCQLAFYASFLTLAILADSERAYWLIIVPQAFGIICMLATGYMQHHHTDADSPWSHSRNFTGWLNNLLHFNHGFHTVHHLDRSLHWSEWPAAHRMICDRIDPRLNEPSLPWYLLRTFLLAPALPWLRSTQIGAVHSGAGS